MRKYNLVFIILFFLPFIACKEDSSYSTIQQTKAPSTYQPNLEVGKKLFSTHCAKCHFHPHQMTNDGNYLHSALNNSNYPTKNYPEHFILNSDSLVNIKDTQTLLILKWSPVDYLHNFKDSLSRHQVKDILHYAKNGNYHSK